MENREWTRTRKDFNAAPKFSGVKWTQIYADNFDEIASAVPSNLSASIRSLSAEAVGQ